MGRSSWLVVERGMMGGRGDKLADEDDDEDENDMVECVENPEEVVERVPAVEGSPVWWS